MDDRDHYKMTENLFKVSAIEKDGYYDSMKRWPLKHTVWQLGVRRIVMRAMGTLLRSKPNIEKVIDVGCGRGDFTLEIARRFPNLGLIKGSDFVENVLDIAKRQIGRYPNVSFQKADVKDMPFEDRFFDLTLCINVLHHVFRDDFEKALSELTRITRKYLIVEIKNTSNFFYRRGVTSAHGINTYSTSEEEVSCLLKKYGMRLTKQYNILLINKLSPLVILVYKRIELV